MMLAVSILLAYLLGSISFGVLASWIFKLPDPRTYGSKNPGATNVLRSGKKAAAVLTLLGDAGKGWLAVALAQYFAPVLGFGGGAIAAVALAVFLGHLFPVFLRFQGGKVLPPRWAYSWVSIHGWGCWRLRSGLPLPRSGAFHRSQLWRRRHWPRFMRYFFWVLTPARWQFLRYLYCSSGGTSRISVI